MGTKTRWRAKPKARHEKLPIAESYSFHMSVVLLYHLEFESTVFFPTWTSFCICCFGFSWMIKFMKIWGPFEKFPLSIAYKSFGLDCWCLPNLWCSFFWLWISSVFFLWFPLIQIQVSIAEIGDEWHSSLFCLNSGFVKYYQVINCEMFQNSFATHRAKLMWIKHKF